MFNGPPRMTGNSEGEVPPPPLEVLIKSKWYRATAAVRDNHFGISLDEDQVRFMFMSHYRDIHDQGVARGTSKLFSTLLYS